MLVKDIIKNTAKLLDLKDVTNYFLDETQEMSEDVSDTINTLVLATNLTNATISSMYIELVEEKQISTTSGEISFSELSSNGIVDIKDIRDLCGNIVDFKILCNKIIINNGTYNVRFTYLPSEVSMSDSINYYTKINALMFAFGVASEYLFMIGDYENAYNWDKRFKENLFACVRPRREIIMKEKRWE